MRKIIRELENITSNGYSHHNVFSDWLDLMLYALIGNEEKYLEVVHKYPNTRKQGEREIDYLANAFGLLLKEMEETNDELLGEIYMDWNMNNKYKGQFFTPKHIASFMAQLISPRGEVINDPTCGSGIMLIETCKLITKEDLDNSLFIAQDIDYTCVRMCALNMTFFNLNAYIIMGDTLKLNDYQKVYKTTRGYLGGSIRELTAEEIETIRPKVKDIIYKSPIHTKNTRNHDFEQLTIF